jgi:hypothetical protein
VVNQRDKGGGSGGGQNDSWGDVGGGGGGGSLPPPLKVWTNSGQRDPWTNNRASIVKEEEGS